ncbi:hypothetical protein H671_1g4028 [Cricetulus griseus]|nr:hypothetical protein H671_1g4028 [Cricetulus griseus]
MASAARCPCRGASAPRFLSGSGTRVQEAEVRTQLGTGFCRKHLHHLPYIHLYLERTMQPSHNGHMADYQTGNAFMDGIWSSPPKVTQPKRHQ